jgi:hypothetical protein
VDSDAANQVMDLIRRKFVGDKQDASSDITLVGAEEFE